MLGQSKRTNQRGDTLIEVLFAITVMALAIVLSLSIMNQGTAASLRSLQITVVRQEIDSQADALRFLNSAYVATYESGYAPNGTNTAAEEYYDIIQQTKAAALTSASPFPITGTTCGAIPTASFIINAQTARYQPYDATKFVEASSYAQVVYDSESKAIDRTEGLWIEALRTDSADGATSFIDFHIRACWGAPGTAVPMNEGTIVRLYDPIN